MKKSVVFSVIGLLIAAALPSIVSAQHCGPMANNADCPSFAPCCSKWGWCGSTDTYCSATACQCGCPGGPKCSDNGGPVATDPPQTQPPTTGGQSTPQPGDGSCASAPLSQRKDLVQVYWGQSQGGNEGPLASYCANSNYDIITVSFLNNFGRGKPADSNEINLSSHCWEVFSGTRLLHCPAIAADVKTCQRAGKKVVLSMGGAIGDYGLTSVAEAEATATHIWNRYLGGNDAMRPFDDAKLDGIDLDLENRQPQYYRNFVDKLRQLYAQDSSKTYYIGAAPQCPFADESLGPDGRAWTGAQQANTVLGNSWFDWVSVQHYNNPMCEAGSADFASNVQNWQQWAASSVNPNCRVLIGLPGNSISAGSGYKSLAQIQAALTTAIRTNKNFGGLMYWDASTATGSGIGPASSQWLKSVQSCSGNPATNPPATNPPATNPPATNPPATNPPATNPPATNPPATNPPATNPPGSMRQCVGVALNAGDGGASGVRLQWDPSTQQGSVEVAQTGAQNSAWQTCQSPVAVSSHASYLHFEVAGSCGARSFRAFLTPAGEIAGLVSASGDVVFSLKC